MEPRIQFARTSDGGSVAFWSQGQGPDLLHLPWIPWGHAQLEWRDTVLRLWYERLSAVCRLVRYDGRGSGLSDWEAPSYGIETQIADMQAVADRLRLKRFGILASLNMGPAAITFASRHPERVSCLMLWCTYARSADYNRAPQVKAIRSLLDSDWDLYTETGAHAFVGWPSGDEAHHLAELMRSSTNLAIVKQFYDEMAGVDTADLLARLRVPVTVLHPREFPLVSVSAARQLASTKPDGRLMIFEGSSLSPTRGDLDGVVNAISETLQESQSEPPASDAAPGAEPGGPFQVGLSSRELEVLRLVAQGLSNNEIAEALVISPRTVERHVGNVYTKVGISNRAQAVAYALSHSIA